MDNRAPFDQNFSKYLLTYKPLPTLSVASGETQVQISPCKAKGIALCESEHDTGAEEENASKYFELPREAKAKLFQCPKTDSIETEELMEEVAQNAEDPPTRDEELQIDDIQSEVDRIMLRISKLNHLLGLNIPECPDMDACLDVDAELKKDSVNPEILQLQRNNRKLQQQISQLQLSRKATDFSMNKLKELINAERTSAGQLQKRLNELDSFKRTLEHEHALCGQRYRYIEKDKYDGASLHPYFANAQVNVKRVLSRLISKKQYERQKVKEMKKIRYLNEHCKKLFDYMFESFDKLDTHIGQAARMQAPELTTFLYRNEKIFGAQRTSEKSQGDRNSV